MADKKPKPSKSTGPCKASPNGQHKKGPPRPGEHRKYNIYNRCVYCQAPNVA